MDLVYICRDGENEELRYSIRSAVKNLKHDNVWVVGGKPDWYTGNFIEVKQSADKYYNARQNMKAIINSSDISDNFILMNDDFFILKRINRLQVYHGGVLMERIRYLKRAYGSSSYTKMLYYTLTYLKRFHNIPRPLNYALHVPFPMNKQKLAQIIDIDISWRVAYGNIFKVGGTEVVSEDGKNKDIKVYIKDGNFINIDKNSISDKFLSTEDNSFEVVLPFLNKKFPDPSPYES